MAEAPYTRANPFPAAMIENRVLNPGSDKETRHHVIDLGDSGLTYDVGDSLGIYAANHPELVSEVLAQVDGEPDQLVLASDQKNEIPLAQALESEYSLAQFSKKLLTAIHQKLPDSARRDQLGGLLDDRAGLKDYIANREIPDVLQEFSQIKLTGPELVDSMRKLVPRLYSIASSLKAHPNQVHLTIAVVRYHTNNRERHGVASTYLAERAPMNQWSIPVYVHPANKFGLPDDPNKDIIMVGPGTGIAPFRAFLEERIATGAGGRNWLFFGDRRRQFDFLYGDELTRYVEEGTLHRLDLAFSRDGAEKVYVQHKMREQSKEIWDWINAGAIFYVCGDAEYMAKDVDQALKDLVAEHGGMDTDAAADYVKTMRKELRYQRDVY